MNEVNKSIERIVLQNNTERVHKLGEILRIWKAEGYMMRDGLCHSAGYWEINVGCRFFF